MDFKTLPQRLGEPRFVLGLMSIFFLFRLTLASLSGFGFHQGWNEGHYALIAHGFLEHPLVPRRGDMYVYNVPPLFSYLVAGSFWLFGESVLAARLPSIVAGTGTLLATYTLGRQVYDREVAGVGTVILAFLPYFQLYAGRAQTDVLMVCLFTAALTAAVRGYNTTEHPYRWLSIAGVLFAASVAAKQPALLLAPVILCWLIANQRFSADIFKRTGVLIASSGISLIPLLAWLYLNYLNAPAAFVADWTHELFSRTVPFANLPLLVAVGLLLGMTPAVLGLASVPGIRDVYRWGNNGERPQLTPVFWWIVIIGAFVLYRTPHGHQYYVVALTPALALLAACGTIQVRDLLRETEFDREQLATAIIATILVVSCVGGSIVLFELSGEFSVANGGGTQVAPDTASYIDNELSANATLVVPNGYGPPLEWYLRSSIPASQIKPYHPVSFRQSDLEAIKRNTSGPVYLVAPSPTWGERTRPQSPIYRSEPYRMTIMSIPGKFVQTDSKFTFYLNDRQLVIYRVS